MCCDKTTPPTQLCTFARIVWFYQRVWRGAERDRSKQQTFQMPSRHPVCHQNEKVKSMSIGTQHKARCQQAHLIENPSLLVDHLYDADHYAWRKEYRHAENRFRFVACYLVHGSVETWIWINVRNIEELSRFRDTSSNPSTYRKSIQIHFKENWLCFALASRLFRSRIVLLRVQHNRNQISWRKARWFSSRGEKATLDQLARDVVQSLWFSRLACPYWPYLGKLTWIANIRNRCVVVIRVVPLNETGIRSLRFLTLYSSLLFSFICFYVSVAYLRNIAKTSGLILIFSSYWKKRSILKEKWRIQYQMLVHVSFCGTTP